MTKALIAICMGAAVAAAQELDCSGLLIENPEQVAAKIDSIIGVVEHGLFLNMASLALIAGDQQVIERSV